MTRRSVEQRIASAEMKIAKRKCEQRQLLTRQKIIIGGVVLISAKKSPQEAQSLAEKLRAAVTRPADVRAIDGVLAELDQTVASAPVQPPSAPPPQKIDPLAGLENVQRRTTFPGRR